LLKSILTVKPGEGLEEKEDVEFLGEN